MSVAKMQNAFAGANPFMVESPPVLGSGIPASNFTLGTTITGDSEAEWAYCKLTLASTTTIVPGTWMQWDINYNATLLTTSNAVLGQRVGIFTGAAQPPTISGGPVAAVTLVAGVYYVWIQRAGQAAAVVSTVTPNVTGNVAETTATAGQANCPATPTVSSKQIGPVSFANASTAFTANTTLNSPTLTNLVGASTGSGPFLGATVTGTGIPASTTIIGLTYSPSATVQSITLSAPATAAGSAIAMTATGVLEVSLFWPNLIKTN